MLFQDKSIQTAIYNQLIKQTAECISWSSVEGVSLNQIRYRLLATKQKAEQAGLPLEIIRLALQIGEYEAQFGN